ncbi:serine/threonine protein kinase [Streptomyces sp. NBC_01620]|uniref:serine/threonine-protein kinase n=1 Tax=unclassified Streptomyces TaxID=2593676 RepID=UPI0036BD5324|nr:serine/threonine protein kinase [Streptomyces sp. NBC_01620]
MATCDAPEVFQPLQADDPSVVAGYRLAARLGAGGMGRVYLSHTQGGRPVAIKVVRPELADDPDFRRRFRREMEAARRVRGAYTAELIDGDADGAPPWLATLYVPGPSLAEAVGRAGGLPVPAVLWLTAGVAEALQAIHGSGIVHRDLKPSNVLLASDGPRVIDFGISLATGVSSYTATGSTIGTPQFMAPEQASGGAVTAATDVFALGQIAAFAALGEPLYGDGPAVSVLYRIVHSEPDLSLLPTRLRPLIARCLAADPAERATLAEVVEWCREQLGEDADAGAGPTVWREVTGPEVTVPPPAPDPTPAHTLPLVATGPQQARDPWAAPTDPGGAPSRRRRTRLAVGAAVTAVVLVLTALAWTVMDVTGAFRGRDHGGSGGTGSAAGAHPGTTTEASTFPSPSAPGAKSGADDDGTAKGEGAASEAADPSATAPASTHGEPHTGQWLDAKNSLSFKRPFQRKDRKGDIRFTCAKEVSCALESDTSVFTMVFGEPVAGVDECRLLTDGQKAHRLPLAAAAMGSEICVQHRNGDVALLVIVTKSTAMPDSAFVTADMTVWRRAGQDS